MGKKAIVILMGVFFIFCLGAVLVEQKTANASDARIVRIMGGDSYNVKGIRLEPEIITVSPGSVVIWNNWARAYEVKIIFEEGKVCDDVSDAETGFKLDSKNCYVTTWIKLGGTTSLRFNEKGTYKYIVETPSGIKGKGAIRVR
jgi:plastocyanin